MDAVVDTSKVPWNTIATVPSRRRRTTSSPLWDSMWFLRCRSRARLCFVNQVRPHWDDRRRRSVSTKGKHDRPFKKPAPRILPGGRYIPTRHDRKEDKNTKGGTRLLFRLAGVISWSERSGAAAGMTQTSERKAPGPCAPRSDTI